MRTILSVKNGDSAESVTQWQSEVPGSIYTYSLTISRMELSKKED